MILIFIEHDHGIISPYSLQLLTYSRSLADQYNTLLKAVLIGQNIQPLISQISTYGLDGIFLIYDDNLENYNTEICADGIIQLAEEKKPLLILAAATDNGNEILSHIGARLNLPMSANTSDIELGDKNKLVRYRWGSSLLEETFMIGKPLLITLALNLYKAKKISANTFEIENFKMFCIHTFNSIKVILFLFSFSPIFSHYALLCSQS